MPAELSIRPIGLRRAVERLAVREDPRLGEPALVDQFQDGGVITFRAAEA
jgi:hypothetical protein